MRPVRYDLTPADSQLLRELDEDCLGVWEVFMVVRQRHHGATDEQVRQVSLGILRAFADRNWIRVVRDSTFPTPCRDMEAVLDWVSTRTEPRSDWEVGTPFIITTEKAREDVPHRFSHGPP